MKKNTWYILTAFFCCTMPWTTINGSASKKSKKKQSFAPTSTDDQKWPEKNNDEDVLYNVSSSSIILPPQPAPKPAKVTATPGKGTATYTISVSQPPQSSVARATDDTFCVREEQDAFDPRVHTYDSSLKMSRLFLAADGGYIKTVKQCIVAGNDVNAADCFGSTPLHMAAVRNFVQIAQILIDAKANIRAESQFGTPLQRAIDWRNKAVKTFLEAELAKLTNDVTQTDTRENDKKRDN